MIDHRRRILKPLLPPIVRRRDHAKLGRRIGIRGIVRLDASGGLRFLVNPREVLPDSHECLSSPRRLKLVSTDGHLRKELCIPDPADRANGVWPTPHNARMAVCGYDGRIMTE